MIEEAFVTRTTGYAAVSALVGARVYANLAPTTVTVPYIVFQVISRVETDSNANSVGYSKTRIQVTAFSTSYRQVALVRAALRDCWRGYAGTIGSDVIWACLFDGEGDVPDAPDVATELPTFGRRIDMVFQHREDVPVLG